MSEFQFQISQRVIVPAQAAGADGVQGVVSGIFNRLGREPSYVVQWMRADASNDEGEMRTLTQAFDQARLADAQPNTKGGLTVSVEVDQTQIDSALDKARELDKIVKRVNRKPARKRTRK